MEQSGRSFSLFVTLGCTVACVVLLARSATYANAQTASATTPPLATLLSTAPATTHTFHDSNFKVSFDYPSNWTFTQKDGEISTFRLEARSATHTTRLRAVAAIPENPYPASTFSGARIYLSVTPRATDASCAQQAAPSGKSKVSEIGGISFTHGHDEQRHICTTDRDEIYTTYRRGACYRFDLAINNFCGGEVSSVKDITKEELEDVRSRMESILETVRFDSK